MTQYSLDDPNLIEIREELSDLWDRLDPGSKIWKTWPDFAAQYQRGMTEILATHKVTREDFENWLLERIADTGVLDRYKKTENRS